MGPPAGSGHTPLVERGFRPVEQPEKPPFDFLADLLVIAALVPSGPVRAAFPGVPLQEIGGRTLLTGWFSLTRQMCYRDDAGQVSCTSAPDEGTYAELTLLLPTRGRPLFVPWIGLTSQRSLRVASAYFGMPKVLTPGTFHVRGSTITSVVGLASVEARLLGSGAVLAPLARRLLPRFRWRATFPVGGGVTALLPTLDRLSPARVVHGSLAVQAPWLPRPVPLLPLALYARGLQMRLALPPDGERPLENVR